MRLLVLASLALTACASSWRSTPPKSATVLETAKPAIAERRLPNGIRLAVSEAGSMLADVKLVWQVSRADAPPEIAGATWLAPQVMTHDERWLRVVRQLGAEVDWDQDRDGAVMGATALATDVDALLNVLSRMVREPRCDERGLATRRRDMMTHLSRTGLAARAEQAVREAMYGSSHAYSDIDLASIERVTCADIMSVMKTALRPARLALVVAAGVHVAQVERIASGYFGSLEGGMDLSREPTPLPRAAIRTLAMPGEAQVVITMGRFISRYASDTEFNLQALRETASFAGAALRHWSDMAYGTYVSLDDLASGYELRITTTVPRERAAEALSAMLRALREPSKIHQANVHTTFSRRMSMLQQHMLRYETVAGINGEMAAALLKGQSAQRTISDLHSLRDGNWGESILWANSRVDPASMNIVLAGDPQFTQAALSAASLAPSAH